jgi:hypothetical protein
VPPPARIDCKRHSGWTAADNGKLLPSRNRTRDKLDLASGSRIDKTSSGTISEDPVEARLVASDTGINLSRPTKARLLCEVWIG